MMAPLLPIILTTILSTSSIAALQFTSPNPLRNAYFQHEIFYSSPEGQFEGSDGISELLPFSEHTNAALKSPLLAGGVEYAAGNPFHTPVLPAVNLFTPNTVQQPAETAGQIENYRKALEEEAREAEREANRITTEQSFGPGIGALEVGTPKSYVSVRITGGGRNYDYGYSI